MVHEQFMKNLKYLSLVGDKNPKGKDAPQQPSFTPGFNNIPIDTPNVNKPSYSLFLCFYRPCSLAKLAS